MVTAKKIRLVNPHKAKSVGAKRAPRKARKTARNPLVLLGATVNPHKGAKQVAAKKPAKKKKSAARKGNPTVRALQTSQKQYKPKRRKSNPSVAGMASQPIELLKFGLIALLGLVATRQVPQMAL